MQIFLKFKCHTIFVLFLWLFVSMQSSFCPKCKKYLTPEIEKCPNCGFDRKKYYDKNFYTPKTNPATFANYSQEPLSVFWKARILFFPPGYLAIFAIGNNRQRFDGIKYLFLSFILWSIFLGFLAYFVFHLTF